MLADDADAELAERLAAGEAVELDLGDGVTVSVGPGDVHLSHEVRAGLGVASDAGVTVALELEITPELRREGTARELVRLVQDARKAAGLEVTDRVELGIEAEGAPAEALATHRDEIASETLATSIVDGAVDGHREERSIDGTPVAVSVRKVG